MTRIAIHALAADELDAHAEALAQIMADTVTDGAAIGYMQPFALEHGLEFFTTQVFPEVRAGRRRLLLARLDGATAGSVQLIIALPPNQPHRCEVAKMMVAPAARRNGIGRALMQAVDAEARAAGKSLITLDTRTGDRAEPLYRTAGFEIAGVIPGFALDPDGRALHATTYMYKTL
ncbi:MAG: GNAT family N-acetyltransferase [Hoeflea sp.]|uniref:GNAT family N-acetyltransferase n=1 Tax=Hoeflea sp. TaxID=1940281 RepID=UPI001DBEA5D6|nr:GNAT family N-acetyltransferase [Hoeflea sp.]MBU4531479.1 GNAT family N-acetyltransferase [Alphaproteobacteria bacterium]MBU4544336.1 GNAT family N-acetyltransferase [Alphaproteobacteria bacterium]MBU4550427.1 GNAT family N-acetyltransferase [Alphaproteobacteria bacterium]MBV1724755.1 GNAT family N-acetyltransferase [Hoeflea sp.]MBV1760775.1 GNAT family N-acetyltransferase [Hoeflea sp.]